MHLIGVCMCLIERSWRYAEKLKFHRNHRHLLFHNYCESSRRDALALLWKCFGEKLQNGHKFWNATLVIAFCMDYLFSKQIPPFQNTSRRTNSDNRKLRKTCSSCFFLSYTLKWSCPPSSPSIGFVSRSKPEAVITSLWWFRCGRHFDPITGNGRTFLSVTTRREIALL